jgi:hypothetical protein
MTTNIKQDFGITQYRTFLKYTKWKD